MTYFQILAPEGGVGINESGIKPILNSSNFRLSNKKQTKLRLKFTAPKKRKRKMFHLYEVYIKTLFFTVTEGYHFLLHQG